MRSCSFLATGLLLAAGCASSSTTATSSTVTPRAASVGKFVWHDLSTDDLPAAERFYSSLLGWDLRRTTRLGKPYAVASCKGELVGGLVAVEPVAGQEVSQWIAYTSVVDVDAAVLYRALSRREQCAERDLGQQ
jgi:uncharacterized protein